MTDGVDAPGRTCNVVSSDPPLIDQCQAANLRQYAGEEGRHHREESCPKPELSDMWNGLRMRSLASSSLHACECRIAWYDDLLTG